MKHSLPGTLSSSIVDMLLLVFNNLLHSRVSQYVFVPTKDIFFNTLDQHADTLEGDRKPPLVLIGDEGAVRQ